jgi:hypothetical protein
LFAGKFFNSLEEDKMGTYLQARKSPEVYGTEYAEFEDLFVEETPTVPWEVKETMAQRNAFLDSINEDQIPY